MTKDDERIERELIDAAKNWLAIDGLWFLVIEERFGLDTAISCDAAVWREFSRIEAERIIKRLNLQDHGGIDALESALHHRLFSYLNDYEGKRIGNDTLEWYMLTCRTQTARGRKNLPLFPCKEIGMIDYETFAKQIDPRIHTECISCPPDPPGGNYYCGWRFTLQ